MRNTAARKTIVGALLLVLCLSMKMEAQYYFSDGFSATGNWILNLGYSRTMGLWTPSGGETFNISGNTLNYLRTQGVALTAYGTEFSSIVSKFSKTNYQASEYQPFGFEITRWNFRFDADAEINGESGRMKSEFGLWLVEDKTLSGVGSKFDNFIMLDEMIRPKTDIEADTIPYSFWTVDEALVTSAKMSLNTVTNGAGLIYSGLNQSMEWCYDNAWGKGSTVYGTKIPPAVTNSGSRNAGQSTTLAAFTMNAGQSVIANCSYTGGDFDLYLYRGTTLIAMGYTANNPEDLSVTVDTTGSYTLKVSNYGPGTGNYTCIRGIDRFNNNTNRFRVSTDGKNLYFSVNPYPSTANSGSIKTASGGTMMVSNTFFLINSFGMSFSNKLTPMISIGATRPDNSGCNLQMDDYIVRSICSAVTNETTSQLAKAGSTVTIQGVIKPAFNTTPYNASANNYAGVQEFYITAPEGYTASSLTNGLVVAWVSNNGSVLKSFTKENGDRNPSAAGRVRLSVKDNNRTIKVRFFATSDAANDVYHPQHALLAAHGWANMAILFRISNFTTLAGADSVGKRFVVYIGNEKYSDTGWTKYATTGKMKAYTANAYNMTKLGTGVLDYNDALLKTVNNPIGYGAIRPAQIYEGMSGTFYYDLFAANPDNNADVTKVKIEIPVGITVSSSGLGSDRLTNMANISISNGGSKSFIVVNYAAEGKKLIAGSGIDTIRFSTTATPVIKEGNNLSNTMWKSTIVSSVNGTSATTNDTNTIYPSQKVIVRKKPPNAQAYIRNGYPIAGVGQSYFKNITWTNTYTYYIKNNGENKNNLLKVLIRLDPWVTNASGITTGYSSVRTSFLSNSARWLKIDYSASGTNIPSGLADTVRFVGYDKTPSLTNRLLKGVFLSYADNGNGEGWMSLMQHSDSWTNYFYTPPANAMAWIYEPNEEGTNDSDPYHYIYTDLNGSTNIQIRIQNNGEPNNHIYGALIFCPPQFTNISGVYSTKGTFVKYTTNGASNVIRVTYTNGNYLYADATGLGNGTYDTISFQASDNVTTASSYYFAVKVKNTTNYNTATPYQATAEHLKAGFIYPKVSADGYIAVPQDYIDTSKDGTNASYYIYNRGRKGNVIRKVEIMLNTNYVVDASAFSNRFSATIDWLPEGKLRIIYNDSSFVGGTNDCIRFFLRDKVSVGSRTISVPINIQNDRGWLSNVGTTSGKSQSVNISPPPTRFAYNILPTIVYRVASGQTTTNVLVISVSNRGVGSNKLSKVRIQIPTQLVGKIVLASNALLQETSVPATSVMLSNGGAYLWVDYSGAGNLSAGAVDRIYLWLKNDVSGVYSASWLMTAMNNSSSTLTNGGNVLMNMQGIAGTNVFSFVDRPIAYLTANNLSNSILTPTLTNAFTYTFKNGLTNIGRSIWKVRIKMAYTFSAISNCIDGDNRVSYVSNDGSGNRAYLEVTYNSKILPQSSGTVKFIGYDTWTMGPNDVTNSFYVNYGDGSGWFEAGTTAGKWQNTLFLNPTAKGLAYSEPTDVPQDFPTNRYSFYIKNNAESGNNIVTMVIQAPSPITNLTGLQSAVKGAPYIIRGNKAIVFYTNTYLLQSAQTDIVRLIGADNVDGSETTAVWQIFVDNTLNTNTATMMPATLVGGKSLDLRIKKPDYVGYTYIFATNSVSQYDSGSVYSTITANYLKFTVENKSGSGNNILKLRIRIPDCTLLKTNTMTLSSLIKTGSSLSLSNGYIVVNYASSPILPTQKDEIMIRVDDTIQYSEATMVWSAEAAYNSTYGKWKPATLMNGKSLTIRYVMPDPSVSVSMTPSEIYLNRAKVVINYKVTNLGSGSSDLDRLTMTLPATLRNGFGVAKVSNSIATNISYNASTGIVTFLYNNLKPGEGDNIFLTVSNTASASASTPIIAEVRNHAKTASVSGDDTLFISTMPTYSITPNNIDTTTAANNFLIYLNNSANASGLTIKRIRIDFPAQFTNFSYRTNEVEMQLLGTVTSLTLDYQAAGSAISIGDKDTLDIRLMDKLEIGTLSNQLKVWADDGTGFIPINVASGKLGTTIFTMPATTSASALLPSKIELGRITNQMTIRITNKATGSGRISFVRITLPVGVDSPSAMTSSRSAKVSFNSTTRIMNVVYTNTGLLDVGKSDTIGFQFINSMNKVTNLQIRIETANLTNQPVYYPCYASSGDYPNLGIDYPPVAVETYFNGDNRLYLIETNITLTYRIYNRSYNSALTQAMIVFGTNVKTVFERISVDASASKAISVTVDSNNNRIVAKYVSDINSGNALKYQTSDDLKITFKYRFTKPFVINMTTVNSVLSDGKTTNVAGLAVGDNISYLLITNSSWGSVQGAVIPGLYPVDAKVYYPDTSILATNDQGANLSATTEPKTGGFVLKRIPAGSYDFEFSKQGFFRAQRVRVSVDANLLKTISTLTLRNDVLQASSSGSEQLAMCYEDTNTRVKFPSGSIDKEFSINIKITPLTTLQKQKIDEQSTIIKTPTGKDGMYGYSFELNDKNNASLLGSVLKLDAVLTLTYSQTSNTGWGWSEDDLAIYYWDDVANNSKWVKVGGIVDKTKKSVSAKVAYIHPFYAVLSKAQAESGVIRNVVIRPKVFTPNGSGDYFNSVRISFELDQAYESYEVRIYNLYGTMIRQFKREGGGYTQGEVAWDGKDTEGYAVKSGVYVYRVIAGGQVYSGTIVIAR